jgi:hypothetical protein
MKRRSQFDRTLSMKLTVVFVLLVFAVSVTVEAAHFHPDTASETHCSLCLSAHSAPAPSQISTAPVLAQVLAPAESSEPQLQSRLFVPSASIRPPPAA